MYAGVPLICIPYAIEQFYNSSLVEHLGIGKYVSLIKIVEEEEVKNEKFIVDFENAFRKMMKKNNVYQITANKLRKDIHKDYEGEDKYPIKHHFLEMISKEIDGEE
uniref:Glucuronosyltransferase n=1 Tax=Meloidogyne javanica TaxID=6303 RepID=A0A915NE13_MELJA